MTLVARNLALPIRHHDPLARTGNRDAGLDTMRGIAILMVIGIHSLQQPLNSLGILVDAPLRSCVPIFLFASGYLTALSARVPIAKRLKAVVIPYATAFVAAYIYMAAHNPEMDHHIAKALVRFVLAYVFVYYYVFVYAGCSLFLWLVFAVSGSGTQRERRLIVLLLISILAGLITGSYLDPLLSRLGFSDSLVEEVRMRDIPFWFSFTALGALIAIAGGRFILDNERTLLSGATLSALIVYAAFRLLGLGDAADYESVAFFGYAGLLCLLLLALDVRSSFFAALGSGSYFIYLWHIFIVMALRDHADLHQFGPIASFVITFAAAATGSVLALLAVRSIAPPRVIRWLGA